MRGNLVLEMIECNSFIAIFSPPNSSELFYICKGFDFRIADHQLEDEFQHMLFLKATNLQNANTLNVFKKRKNIL